jgi:UDP-GlcNAc:undecaprenyl-phosphate GlcNAc-1-phosphate transferase
MLMSLLTVVGVRSGALAFTVLCATGLAGALLGFLRFNFPPAKIYMGDGGAYFIGFVIGLLSLMNSQKGTIVAALIAPLFALALPIIDVATAIMRRGMQGLPIFRADRKHLHHRLLAKGLSRRRAVVTMYVVCVVCLVFAFAVFCLKGVWLPFVFGGFALSLLFAGHRIDFGRDYLALGRVLGNSIDLRKESRYALPLVKWLELEAERVSDLPELSEAFEFICRKFRFQSVNLRAGLERAWTFSKAPACGNPEENHLRYDLPGSDSAWVEFVAGERMSRASFELLSELAAEAWFKALQRWEQLQAAQQQNQPLRREEMASGSGEFGNGELTRINAKKN